MGRKKYFCDYCQKAFNDDPKARALHLKSARHLQLKDEHYKMFQSPEEVLKTEMEKGPCKMYQRTGDCRFGSSCRFSHFLPEDMELLQRQLHENRSASETASIPTFNEWFAQHTAQTAMGPVLSHSSKIPEGQLPPSLRPFDVTAFLGADLSVWGK